MDPAGTILVDVIDSSADQLIDSHGIDEARLNTNELQRAKATLVQMVQLVAKDLPINGCACGYLQRREHVEYVHVAIHDESLKRSFELFMHEEAVFGREGRGDDRLSQQSRLVGLVISEKQESLVNQLL